MWCMMNGIKKSSNNLNYEYDDELLAAAYFIFSYLLKLCHHYGQVEHNQQ